MVEEFKKTEGIDLSNDKMAVQRLKDAAEKAKIELSSTTTTNINIPFITADATGAKHLDMNLTVAKFNELTKDLVDATMGPVQQALSDSGLSPSDLNKILMVGGSSRIPAVQEAVRQKLGKEPFKGINPDECVALGAAISGRCPRRRCQGRSAAAGNTAQRASGDFARHLLANFPSYFTKMLVNTSSIHSAFCFI